MRPNLLLPAVALASAFLVRGTHARPRVTPENGRAVVLENQHIRAVIDPDRGGAIVSFVHKATGRDVIARERKYVGLFLDHFWGQTWPGELLEVPYEIQILDRSAKVRVSRTVTGDWKGTQQKIIKGIRIEKTYELRADVAALFCHIVVKNPQPSGRLPAYWPQHVFFIGGDYDAQADRFYRPSTRGVRMSHRDTKREHFLRDPVAGWSAAVDTRKGDGIAFLMDYNYLDMLYNCGGNSTLEWMYDKIPVPAGRQWETGIVVVPTTGITEFAHASHSVIAGLAVQREPDAVVLKHQIRATTRPLADVSLTARVVDTVDQRHSEGETIRVGGLTTETASVSQRIGTDSKDPLAIHVRIVGRSGAERIEERYFVFFAGSYGYGDNVQQDMMTPVYQIPRPEKKQVLMRPAGIVRTRRERPRAFVLRGLNADVFRIDEALRELGCETDDKDECRSGFYSIGQAGPRTSDFPFDYDGLMSYDLVIIANANIQCLSRLGLEMLRDYVTHGGGLLFLGGKAAYGAGGVGDSPISDLLPIQLAGSQFDIGRLANGRIRPGVPHPITAGLRLDGAALDCTHVHRTTPANSGQVILWAHESPLLLVGQAKQGRMACLMGTPYRGGKQAATVFDAPLWQKLLTRVLQWLSQR